MKLGKNRMRVAELEFAFRVGEDIEPKGREEGEEEWGVEEVMDRVDGLFLGCEVPDSRYEDFTKVGAPALVADIACGDWYVLGPEVRDWRERNLVGHVVRGWVEGREGEVMVGKGGKCAGGSEVCYDLACE